MTRPPTCTLVPYTTLFRSRAVGGANEWEAVDGVLRNRKSGGNLVTDAVFDDFKLHIEFRYPAGGNSGVYLRGRYEDRKSTRLNSSHLVTSYAVFCLNKIRT